MCPVVSNAPEAGWGILEDSSTEGRERETSQTKPEKPEEAPVRLSVSVAHASGVQAELHGAPRLAFPQKRLFSAMSCVPPPSFSSIPSPCHPISAPPPLQPPAEVVLVMGMA